jgi:hypothetical protein
MSFAQTSDTADSTNHVRVVTYGKQPDTANSRYTPGICAWVAGVPPTITTTEYKDSIGLNISTTPFSPDALDFARNLEASMQPSKWPKGRLAEWQTQMESTDTRITAQKNLREWTSAVATELVKQAKYRNVTWEAILPTADNSHQIRKVIGDRERRIIESARP